MNIKVNGITLEYSKEGTGEPLILLHGNGEDHHIFDKLAEKLKEKFTVYAIDSRNHGKSSMTDDYSYETMAEDIFSFINALELGRIQRRSCYQPASGIKVSGCNKKNGFIGR